MTALLLTPGRLAPDLAPAAPPSAGPVSLRALARRLPGACAHNLLNLPLGVGLFMLVAVSVSTGVGLLGAFLLGAPVLLATLLLGATLGRWERDRARRLLYLEVDEPPHPMRGQRLPQRVRALVTDGTAWRSLAYALVLLPWGALTFGLTVGLWATAVRYALFPVQWWVLGADGSRPLGWHAEHGLDVLPITLFGWMMLVVAAAATLGLSRVSGALVHGLLGPSQAQRDRRVAELTNSRRRVVDGAATERRRIERDLHDGAQQRLVGLALTLGRAERDLAGGEVGAGRALVAQARGEATQALADLRDLVRGIHPAVLADRGLDAALSAVAARSALPVLLDVDPDVTSRRPDRAVEEAAYFVVTEAVANAAKHSQARTLAVDVQRLGGSLVVSVHDDGRGGATALPGGGLAGLADRVAALDGTLALDSPSGGPTRLTATLPG